jgi:hypothetical protein
LVEYPQKIIPYLITGWKYGRYSILRALTFSMWKNLLTVKLAALSFGRI